ncbi:MAG: hypothetical protein PHF84_01495 [bacterium]|nr:hypothetical protein [bacterium]
MLSEFKFIFPARAMIPFYILLFIGLYYLTRFSYKNEKNLNERMKNILTGIRTAVWSLIILALINPLLQYYFLRTVKNKCFILIDNSLSMSVPDKNRNTRFSKAGLLLQSDTLKKLGTRFDMRYFFFDSRFIAVSPGQILKKKTPDGDATDIGHSLLNLLTMPEKGLHHVVLLSDGINNVYNDFPPILQQLKNRDIRIYPVDLSDNEKIRDISLMEMDYPEEVNINSDVTLDIKINSLNYNDTSVPISILLNDKPVRSQRLALRDGINHFKTSLSIKAPGIHKITVTAEPKEDESITLNNSRSVFIRTMKSRFKVLYLCGTPGFEYKFIKLALESDPGISLDAYANVRGELKALREVMKYDLVIIGDIKYRDLPDPLVQSILGYVQRRNGSLLFLGGRNSFRNGGYHLSLFKEIIPVEWQESGEILKSEFSLKLTAAGLTAPFLRMTDDMNRVQEFWDNLAPLSLINVVKSVKKGTQVLAVSSRQENLVLLAVGQYKQARIGLFTGYPTWKWGFINLGLGNSDNPFNVFWQQFVRYLVNFNLDKINLFTNKLIYKKDEDIFVKLFLYSRDFTPVRLPQVEIKLHKKTAKGYVSLTKYLLNPSPATAGLYESVITVKDYGEYMLEADLKKYQYNARTFFIIKNPEVELYELKPDHNLLKRIAGETSGEYLKYKDFHKLNGLLKAGKIQYRIKTEKSIWENWFFLLLVISLLSAEWYIRKKNGLP